LVGFSSVWTASATKRIQPEEVGKTFCNPAIQAAEWLGWVMKSLKSQL
jgi:hypothetical protein